MLRKGDLTQGGITTTLLQFTLPMLAGSLLQQCYNIADTLIVGQCIGAKCVGSGRFRLYLDGFPDLYPAGVIDGKRHGFLTAIRSRRPVRPAT